MAIERFPVEASHILMFARAVGDPNPIYADETYAAGTEVGGIIAPPTFVQSSAQFDPDYLLRPSPASPGSAPARSPPGSRGSRRRRRRSGSRPAGCTPSSTSRTTATSAPATC